MFQVRDAREAYNEKDAPEIEEVPEDREPSLNGFTAQWDLKLFREAQVFFSMKFYLLTPKLEDDRNLRLQLAYVIDHYFTLGTSSGRL